MAGRNMGGGYNPRVFNLSWVETALIRPSRKPDGVLFVQALVRLPSRRRRIGGFPRDALSSKSLKLRDNLLLLKVFRAWQPVAELARYTPTVGPGGLRGP